MQALLTRLPEQFWQASLFCTRGRWGCNPYNHLNGGGGLSADDVAAVLGLPDGVDPLHLILMRRVSTQPTPWLLKK